MYVGEKAEGHAVCNKRALLVSNLGQPLPPLIKEPFTDWTEVLLTMAMLSSGFSHIYRCCMHPPLEHDPHARPLREGY